MRQTPTPPKPVMPLLGKHTIQPEDIKTIEAITILQYLKPVGFGLGLKLVMLTINHLLSQ